MHKRWPRVEWLLLEGILEDCGKMICPSGSKAYKIERMRLSMIISNV